MKQWIRNIFANTQDITAYQFNTCGLLKSLVYVILVTLGLIIFLFTIKRSILRLTDFSTRDDVQLSLTKGILSVNKLQISRIEKEQ